jgi:F0F1-type ATP synthase assembly protein I
MQATNEKTREYANVLALSAWGFAIVIASFLFLYIGYWLDKLLDTTPTFMFGLFLLAIMLCVGRLYRDAWMMREDKNVKR